MILVFLTGGLSHLDSLDMKPDAPEGIRGEFHPIATGVPGIQVCEHLPELAARALKLAIVRSLAHPFTNHLNATHELLTGIPSRAPSSTRSPRGTIIPAIPRGSTLFVPGATACPAG